MKSGLNWACSSEARCVSSTLQMAFWFRYAVKIYMSLKTLWKQSFRFRKTSLDCCSSCSVKRRLRLLRSQRLVSFLLFEEEEGLNFYTTINVGSCLLIIVHDYFCSNLYKTILRGRFLLDVPDDRLMPPTLLRTTDTKSTAVQALYSSM